MRLANHKGNAATSRVFLVVCLLSGAIALLGCKKEPQTASAGESPVVPAVIVNANELDPAANLPAAPKVNGKRALQFTSEFVGIGSRPLGSAGHAKAEAWIQEKFQATTTQIEQDTFSAQTPAGQMQMKNIIAKFPGRKDGVIVIAGHYDTNYPLRDRNFVGANDGGSSTGLMVELATVLSSTRGKDSNSKLDGYSVWLVALDGEEAIKEWTAEDSVYGSKHLSAKWKQDGTATKIKAFILLDMIGDKDLNIEHDLNSTPWLQEVVLRAATRLGTQSHFYRRDLAVEDDHIPFAKTGIPVIDLIDLDYGMDNVFHHTTEDTMDKLSSSSLQIVGDVVLETMRAINTK